MTDPLFVIGATTLIIVLSAFFVIIEFSLMGARRHRLEARAASSRSARAALRGVHELTIMLAVAQLGITACTFALGAVTKPAVDAWLGPLITGLGAPGWLAGGASFALALFVVTFLHLVVGEMAPKSWAIAHPELAATIIGLPSRGLARLFRPLLRWVNDVANRLVAASGVEPVDQAAVGGRDADTIRQLVDHSASVGALDAAFRTQISRVLDLERIVVADLVPDTRPTGVPEDATVADVQQAAIASGHMRILVGVPGDGAPRQVHVRDTLDQSEEATAARWAREALVLEADIPVHEALTRMRAASEQLAVVHRDGGFLGVVTITDILRRVLPRERVGSA
ncbi:MAG: CNNM domain-containing protein [Janibacter sp.]